jgi:hypothetical protein
MEPHGTTTANEDRACLLGYFVCLVVVAARSHIAPMSCSIKSRSASGMRREGAKTYTSNTS